MDREKRKRITIIDIISCIIAFFGVVATIVSAHLKQIPGFQYIFIGLITTQLTVICIWFWVLKDSHKKNITIEKKESQIKNLQDEKEQIKEEIELSKKKCSESVDAIKQKNTSYQESVINNIQTISINIKNVSKLYNDFSMRIPKAVERSYHYVDMLSNIETITPEKSASELQFSFNEFEINMFDIYKKYSKNILDYLVLIEESYLNIKSISQRISATIKLFNIPYICADDRSKIVVYTAFRDKKTYDEKNREIGEGRYTIDGNVDFNHCLSRDFFLINNAKKDSTNYMNEHKDFDQYYNCAIVVPIKTKIEGGDYKYYGFLCCDCLNKNEGEEPFDEHSANFLFAVSQHYATFLDLINANWKEGLKRLAKQQEDFLDLIFRKTFISFD